MTYNFRNHCVAEQYIGNLLLIDIESFHGPSKAVFKPAYISCLQVRPLLNTLMPIFRHPNARDAEKHQETNRNQLLHSCFELTKTEISRCHVECHLKIASNMQPVSPLGRFIKPSLTLEGEQSAVLAFYAGAQNAHLSTPLRENMMTGHLRAYYPAISAF